jgi:hypothetical protein
MRSLLAVLLAAGLVGLVAAPERPALLIAVLFMLPAFLLGGAKLAVDLIELVPADLIADAALLAALGAAFTTISMGNRLLVGALLAAAFATQAVRLAGARRARLRGA